MDTVAYRVIEKCYIGPSPDKEAVYEVDAVLQLPEEIGDACPYVVRADGSKKKKAPPVPAA